MPTFRYIIAGAGVASTIDAVDRGAAVRELVRQGLTPTLVEPVNGATAARGRPESGNTTPAPSQRAWTFGSAMSRSEMASFVRELATALQAGLPLVPAMRTIARQGRSARQKAMLAQIIAEVEHGRSLADAAEQWGKPFTELIVSLMRAGEASGRLPEILTQTANLLDRDVKLRRSVMAATLYPAILLTLIIGAIVVIVTFIVPSILKGLPQTASLPWPTRVVQGTASFIAGWWMVIVPVLAGLVFLGSRLLARPEVRLPVDRFALRVPILGRLLRDVAVARFTRTLGTLTVAGVPVLSSLRITKRTLGNRAMEDVLDRVCDQVTGGRTIADPMEESGYFPPMLVQIVNLGERSGKLDEMLAQAAGAFEERTETSVKLFTTALPPALVVCMAGVVGFVVLAILLPLLQVQESIGS